MVTIRDVAADAGVAPSTVSYVLSGNKRLPDATVQKVLTSVSRLGYRPSPTGRALALGRTNIIIGMLASFSQTTTEDETDVFMRFVGRPCTRRSRAGTTSSSWAAVTTSSRETRSSTPSW